jgi:hypothetical protein
MSAKNRHVGVSQKKMLGLREITRPQVRSIADSDDRIVLQWRVTERDEQG